MAILSITANKKKNGIIKLNAAVKKLQKSLLIGKGSSSSGSFYKEYVPNDVEEGHFAVIAMERDESRRFVVPLKFLNHPTFLSLLEKAAEEYGFNNEGAVTIPCRPTHFEKMLAEEWRPQRWGI